MFADKATIEVRAGKGGDGRLGFRHEKYLARGGPDGGDGGHGGNVVFRVEHNLSTLAAYRTAKRLEAQDGQPGGQNRRHGKNGEDVVVPVPAGTQIYEGDQLLADLTEPGEEAVIAKGGRGGFGNSHFISSTRQAPRTAELGEPGEQRKLRLELKLVAEVGFVGLPNAGKSTLLSVITNAKPEIGDYAFTTLIPNLGVVDHRDHTFLAADIPGLIEGASAGKGLGDEFLRHVERTAVLLHLVDGLSDDVAADWHTVEGELAAYGHGLTDKPRLAVLTKAEGLTDADRKARTAALQQAAGRPVYVISAQAHRGLTELLDATTKLVLADRQRRAEAAEAAAAPVINLQNLPGADRLWFVNPGADEHTWDITGEHIEGFARRTNFDNDDAVARLRDIVGKIGISRELRRLGAEPGDMLVIGRSRLTWLG
ncbi:MAG TPA: GTPase ObgE [Candidatus Saccharimonadia bacterium]